MKNIFGKIFRITSFGESHGVGVGVVIDGCPAGLEISQEEIQAELNKRRPGQDQFSTPRDEKDQVEILSGVFEGKTLGTSIGLLVRNKDANSKSYETIKNLYRPGHADFVYEQKYGIRDWRGGGRASARETIARVAAGAIAKKLLANSKVDILGFVRQIGNTKTEIQEIDRKIVESNPLRCPDPETFEEFSKEIEDAKADGDSVGGVVEVVVKNLPVGLGEPVFNKLSADLAQALVSIPAVKGFEIGDGFECATKRGSENNDELVSIDGKTKTKTNHAGGIVGGISNGEDLVLRIALKPPSSISKKQKTVNKDGEETTIEVHGRHDPCVCARAVPVAEAMVALVLADHILLNRSSRL